MKNIKKHVTIDRVIFVGIIVYLLMFSNNNKDAKDKIEVLKYGIEESMKREESLRDSLLIRDKRIKIYDKREDSLIRLLVIRNVKINDLSKRRNEKGDIIINKFDDSELVEFFASITIPKD